LQPHRYSQAQDFHSAFRGNVTSTPVSVAFTPIGYKSPGLPKNAPGTAVPALIAYRIVVSNPGSAVIRVAPVLIGASATNAIVYPPADANQVPAYVDPSAFVVPDGSAISIPAGAIAFEISIRAYGLSIDCPTGTADVMVQAYGALTLIS
jgi:hypothetical protein